MGDLSTRVLILAASQKDADSAAKLLEAGAIECFACRNIQDIEREIERGAGALVLAKEILLPASIATLAGILGRQPAWSFLPTILLVAEGDLARPSEGTLGLFRPIRNLTFLERPVRIGTFISVVQAALSDRKRQYEVRDLLRALEQSREDAIAASEAKSSFLANMSHEIRTPLGAILGFSELLLEPSVAEEDKRAYLQTIQRNGQLLSALIEDVLDLSKVESGRVSVESIEVALKELVSEVVSLMEPRAAAKKIGLFIEWQPGIANVVKTDPVRLKQILVNILGNAIKFTSRGRITMQFSASAGLLRMRVRDTGVGIASSQAANLFQPFTQADSSITRRYGGTGLGLVLSKKLAQAMGGDLVLVESEIGVGSTFEISIRVGEASQTHTLSRKEAAPAAAPTLAGRRILIIDDSQDNQVLIGRMLKLAGAQIGVANDGIEGVEAAMNGAFDVVLMDVQMPRLGGHEATAQLRSLGYSRPIVALTAHALKEDRDRCLRAGCSGYLTKPIQRLELIETVARLAAAEGESGASYLGADRGSLVVGNDAGEDQRQHTGSGE